MVSPIRGLWSLVSSFPHLPLSKSVNPATGVGVTVQGGRFLRTSPPRRSIKGAGNLPSSQWKESTHSQGSVQKTQHRNEVIIPPARPPLSIVDNSSVPSFGPVATVEFTPRTCAIWRLLRKTAVHCPAKTEGERYPGGRTRWIHVFLIYQLASPSLGHGKSNLSQ